MYDFIADLDNYFCEKYANYDKLCILPGYKMPMMQASRVDDFGRTQTYTLPSSTLRLATQAKKAELLAELKKRMTDTTFSFSFKPYGLFRRIANKFSKFAVHKSLNALLTQYDLTDETVLSELEISEEIWHKMKKGAFEPTKNFIYSLALVGHFSYEDTKNLMLLCNEEFDYAIVKDVVMAYLLEQRVYNDGMIKAACDEYKVTNLFLK